MANLYYREDLPQSAFAPGETIVVDGDEAHHAVRVSRLRVGERILLGNGAGSLAQCTVTAVDKHQFEAVVDAAEHLPAPQVELVLVQALAKGDRDERAVEQSTEFGIDRIVPWEAARSVSRWGGGEKTARGIAKWQRIAREAAKQSLRARVPEVSAPVRLTNLAALAAHDDVAVLVLHPGGQTTLSGWATEHSVRQVYVVIGPEGGFSDEEIDALAAAGAEVLLLGRTVLRTSSAGPAALAVLNVSLGRW